MKPNPTNIGTGEDSEDLRSHSFSAQRASLLAPGLSLPLRHPPACCETPAPTALSPGGQVVEKDKK